MLETFPLERPRRRIFGASAILLPFSDMGEVNWGELQAHIQRTCDQGLTPAVNMDTGYVHLIDEATEDQVLGITQAIAVQRSAENSEDALDRFIAGAVVRDQPGSSFDYDQYARRIEKITQQGGTPIVFPSFGLNHGADAEIFQRFQRLARLCPRFYAFELGTMFAPCGRIYSLDLFGSLLQIPECVGAKHSSLDRILEWKRLELRDRVRPEFRLLTGNDLAIDMVKYGSDYLLGLSTMAPDWFALRDQYWLAGDARFFALNDRLQYLGWFTFRDPVPAYRHSAAQWLCLRGWTESDRPHPACPLRPDSDRAILQDLLQQMETLDGHSHSLD